MIPVASFRSLLESFLPESGPYYQRREPIDRSADRVAQRMFMSADRTLPAWPTDAAARS
jgi:hypothetical protein